MEVKETVIQIIAEQALLDPSDITLDSSMEDLAIDSPGLGGEHICNRGMF